MKILHILDHSIPLQAVIHTFRTRNILRHQRELGTANSSCMTGLKHKADITALEEDVDGLHFIALPAVHHPYQQCRF
ncbi:MAG: hypothetical protein R3E73_03790 [Porticoccaceae bacterium]